MNENLTLAERRRAGKILRKAVGIIETHGWQTKLYGNASVGFCAVGAIQWVGITDDSLFLTPIDVYGCEDAFMRWLKEHVVSQKFVSIEDWNDQLAGSKEEVIATMRKAADDLDPQQI